MSEGKRLVIATGLRIRQLSVAHAPRGHRLRDRGQPAAHAARERREVASGQRPGAEMPWSWTLEIRTSRRASRSSSRRCGSESRSRCCSWTAKRGASQPLLRDAAAAPARGGPLRGRGRRLRAAPPRRRQGGGRPRDRTRRSATVHELRAAVAKHSATRGSGVLAVSSVSFGFKHGLPRTGPLLRRPLLVNPHFDARLRPLTGRHRGGPLHRGREQTEPFYRHLSGFLNFCLPNYRRENRAYLRSGSAVRAGAIAPFTSPSASRDPTAQGTRAGLAP